VTESNEQGDGSASVASRFVYPHHRKPLLAVSFVEGSRLAASCDGAVHLWDPFVGTSVRQLDGAPTVTAVRALPPPSASLVCATAEGTLRLLDTRSPLAYQHEFKVRLFPFVLSFDFDAPSFHMPLRVPFVPLLRPMN